MINFVQNKIDKEITENFKCYEIIALGGSIILIEFLQSSNALKKKLREIKNDYYLTHINQNLECKMLQKPNSPFKEYLFRHHPRNMLQTCFFNDFPDPLDWYRMRKRYALSYAVWSMCAYVVRLGDRHLDNIMINDFNQIIFIDYGYVMNDGITLPVPEKVPIRFTNNLRYALGFLEESGVYFNACFKVLKTIYKHSNVIFPQMKAILEHTDDNFSFDANPNRMNNENEHRSSSKK